MEVDDDLKNQILSEAGPVVGSALAAALTAAAGMAILALVTTNHKMETPAGDLGVHPTKEDTKLAGADVTGAGTEGSLAKDKVGIANGEVKAAETEARASTTEATASEAGASASRAKAGASDIEAKALKIT